MHARLHIFVVFLVSLTSLAGLPVYGQNELGSVNFAVMALDVDRNSRRLIEDALVERLRMNDYQVSASYPVINRVRDIDTQTIRTQLAAANFDAVLIIRPLDIGSRATIDSVQAYLTPDRFKTIAEFVEDYRGDNFNTRAVIHIVGYILDETRSLPVWQGVMWFDDETHSVDQSVNKIVDLVEYNLNHYRPSIRQQLGLPPLSQVD